MSTIIKPPTVIEKTFACSDGVKLATRHWINFDYNSPSTPTQDDTRKILCLHGWLDNAASFNRLAPLLLDSTGTPTEIVCLDFPGHGLSGECYSSLFTRVYDMIIIASRVCILCS
jgi:pimeloyl-ACP methyl ester carboxylesterase